MGGAGLHVLGERRAAILTGRPRGRLARRRAITFYAGLATVFVALARATYCSQALAPARELFRALATPMGAWLLFAGGLYAWHLPAAYDLALKHTTVHSLQHITFMGAGSFLGTGHGFCPREAGAATPETGRLRWGRSGCERGHRDDPCILGVCAVSRLTPTSCTGQAESPL